ncbi:hypothetical protein [Gemmatimonas sp.]|uniref:hypothetical protein n=1 Tax=Gemmatimonas sp. TaxID=1962908 RepID=UPI003567EC7B
MPPLSRVLLRRLGRVAARSDESDPPDLIMDDVFVVWRAFEGSWPQQAPGSGSQRTAQAVDIVLQEWGFSELPYTKTFIEALKCIGSFSQKDFANWFHLDQSEINAMIDDVDQMRERVRRPSDWTKIDTANLGDVLHKLRCSIFHPSLDTETAGKSRLLPALRASLQELTLAHGAARAGLAPEQARAAFIVAVRAELERRAINE